MARHYTTPNPSWLGSGSANPLYKHGMSNSAESQVWRAMRQRCNNPNYTEYAYYGGRGIKVCERWDSFINFYADMGPRPSRKHSIDRIDNNGNYEPSNCRWATMKEQSNNQRPRRRTTHCHNGHEFTEENTYWNNNCRTCRKCRAAKAQKRRSENGVGYQRQNAAVHQPPDCLLRQAQGPRASADAVPAGQGMD